ncbi:uncharacterized protein LOC129572070, partial [Sitodiplosis mosellana]|uniref:uncharacterized protein LOC129572070 n=1 Tax=Sitodiplosis mosellana TaxID=263140 RepID=UPI002444BE80
MARNIRRHTKKKYPAGPKNTTEIKQAYDDDATMQEFGLNLRRTNYFYVDTVGIEGCEFTVFASYDMMGMVNEHIPPEGRRYMLDGTFDVVPIRYFYQLLVIAIEYKNDNETSSLSVAHLLNRTSSPLESLNSILNRSIAKRTHFFRFVARLKFFESKKSNDMSIAVNSSLPQS